MKNSIWSYAFLVNLLVLSSCTTVKTSDQASSKQADELCEQVNSLVEQHQQGFKDLKSSLVISPRMDIWRAKFHLVGNDCQIWGWSDGKQTYMCSQVVPAESIAIERYKKAIDFTQQCLGNQWTAENIDREHGRSFRTIFTNPELTTVTSVHRVKTEGLFKTEWTVYYFIGDRDHSL
ncbi:MAG: hypothetical protein ACN4GM_02830 [Gammaproteobacteria bacterium]